MKKKADRVRKPGCFPFKAKPLHALLLAVLACWQMDMRASQTEHTAGRMPPARAQHIEFNSSFLRGGDGIDVLRFAEGNSVEPGLYNPDLLVNGNWMARTEVRFTQRSRSEEHTSELQSPCNLVCRLLLEKKKIS